MVKTVKTVKTEKSRTKRPKKVALPHTHLQDLNDDVLIEIFSYLDVRQLIQMCKIDDRFKSIILSRVIKLKLIDFSELHKTESINKVFQLFGRSMTRVSVDINNIQKTRPHHTKFEELLRLIVEFCSPGQLQQVFLSGFEICKQSTIRQELLTTVGTYFENVHTLHFNLPPEQIPFFAQFMREIPKHNLRELFVRNIQSIGDWLNFELLPRLKRLHFSMSEMSSVMRDHLNVNRLMTYIAQKPQLEQLIYEGRNSDQILNTLSQHVPLLTHIGTFKNFVDDHWNCLTRFSNLKEFILETEPSPFLQNSGNIFRILAEHNSIESLEIHHNSKRLASDRTPLDVKHLRKLTKVKELRLVDFNYVKSTDFMEYFFRNLTALEVCTFAGKRMPPMPIYRLVGMAKNIRIVNVNCELKKFNARSYRQLLRIRYWYKMDSRPLVMNFDAAIVKNVKTELRKLGPRYSYKSKIITLNPKKA